jgi:signal transduction histidine kinase
VGGAQSLLRTLLRGMAGEINDQQKEILSRVEKRLNQLLELINDLLSLAASKTFEEDRPLEPVALQPVVWRIVEQFSVEAGHKDIKLTLDAPEDSPTIHAREDGLATIFTNLVGNAIKYTPEGGRVEVRIANLPEVAVCTVADSGIGIPEKDLCKLWEEFFRASNVRSSGITGTGLGLSIVKQYVDRYKGKIEVQSKEGQGTIFTVTFPKNAEVKL